MIIGIMYFLFMVASKIELLVGYLPYLWHRLRQWRASTVKKNAWSICEAIKDGFRRGLNM